MGAAAAACAVALLAAAPASQAQVQVGSSGWRWGNPLPQGNTIRALSFAGGRGYAVGDFGTLLRTDDGGATWSGLRPDAHRPGRGPGHRRRLAVRGRRLRGAPIRRRRADLRARGLHTRRVELSRGPGHRLVRDEGTGYLVLADGTVLRTDDDGETFSQRTALPETRAQGGTACPADVVFTGRDTGVAATSDGRLHRTTDGGTSWALVSATERAVRELAFVDATTGYAVGDGRCSCAPRTAGRRGALARWPARPPR